MQVKWLALRIFAIIRQKSKNMGIFEIIRDILTPDGVVMAAILPWIGAGISAASSIGNAIFGSISADKQKREQLRAIRKQQRENKDWYNRRYNEDATQRADVQRMLSRTNEAIKARNRAAAGKKAVVGGTDASLASTQQANAEAVGDALSQVSADAEARKDNIEAQYRERKADLDAQEAAVKAGAPEAKRTATAQAATSAANAGASILANSLGDVAKSGKPDVTAKSGVEGKIKPKGVVITNSKGQDVSVNPDILPEWKRNSIFDSPYVKRIEY